MRRRLQIFAALIAAAGAAPALAESTDATAAIEAESTDAMVAAAIEFIETLSSDATSALTNEAASEAQRVEDLRLVLADGLALDRLASFMIGSKAAKELSDEQAARYNAVFPFYITQDYATQFDEIVSKPIVVVDAGATGRSTVIVRTELERKESEPLVVDWRVVRMADGVRKVLDIIVNGTSTMTVKREEFVAFMKANGIDALIDRLEQEAQIA